MRVAIASRLCLLGLAPALLLSTALAQDKKDEKPRFIDRGEYIEDTTTKLLWQKDGAAAGKKNFQQAAEYAQGLKLGSLKGWRVPTAKELAGIFPAEEKPFLNSKYNPNMCCAGPVEFAAFWTSDLDAGDDYAFVYQWYAKGGANNCIASRNFVYVRCVRDIAGVELAAAAKPADAKADAKKIQRAKELIAQLGDDKFETREAATKELLAIAPAIEALIADSLERTSDFEVRLWLKRIMAAIVGQK